MFNWCCKHQGHRLGARGSHLFAVLRVAIFLLAVSRPYDRLLCSRSQVFPSLASACRRLKEEAGFRVQGYFACTGGSTIWKLGQDDFMPTFCKAQLVSGLWQQSLVRLRRTVGTCLCEDITFRPWRITPYHPRTPTPNKTSPPSLLTNNKYSSHHL
jgi:hypothetical protein